MTIMTEGQRGKAVPQSSARRTTPATASGKYDFYDNGGAGGVETAAAVLLTPDEESVTVEQDSDYPRAVVILRDAEVNKAKIQYQAGQDQAAKDAALVDLEALGIISR